AEEKLEWDPAWPRIRPWEYVVGPALVGGALTVRYLGPQVDRNWQGGILFDDWVIDAIAVRGSFRATVSDTSDAALYGSLAYRFLDSMLLPGLLHGGWDVGLQMSFIDIESLGVLMTILWGAQVVVARERPFVKQCLSDPQFAAANADCEHSGEWDRSFIAGHSAVGVAMASLTCLHHTELPLYGGGIGDDLACGVLIGAAVLNGLGRVMSENHYTTDLLLGEGLGLFAGYVVPRTLHYGWGGSRETTTGGGVGVVILPTFGND